jgi:hypothetical protein
MSKHIENSAVKKNNSQKELPALESPLSVVSLFLIMKI